MSSLHLLGGLPHDRDIFRAPFAMSFADFSVTRNRVETFKGCMVMNKRISLSSNA